MNKPVTTLTATLIASLFAVSAFAVDAPAPKSTMPAASTSTTVPATVKHAAKLGKHKKSNAKTEDKK